MNEVIREIEKREVIKEEKKLKVAAYARVSTSNDMQLESFDTQVEVYTKKILDNPNWEFVGIFADEGKSGTSLRKRDQFNMMIEIAKSGGIDLILTKSISRFARNTIDCLTIIQELKAKNVEVFFERENISSLDTKIEFLISILSGIAEEEAKSTSSNIKWSWVRRCEAGEFFMDTKTAFLGYTKDKNNKIIIDEEKAPIIRKIFSLYIEGHGLHSIQKYLNSNQIQTAQGKNYWHTKAIDNILKNEKYMGDALLQKTYKPSFNRGRRKNNGEVPQFYVCNSHPGIISKETFKKAQDIRKVRALKYNIGGKRRNVTPYTHFVKCGYCGKYYHQKTRRKADGTIQKFLQCSRNKNEKKCKANSLSPRKVDNAIIKEVNQIIRDKKAFFDNLSDTLYNNPAYLDLKQQLKIESDNLVNYEKQLKEIDINDDFNKTVHIELNNKIYETKILIAKIKTTLTTKHNFEIIIKSKKNILSKYKKPIKSIDEFPYKKFFKYVLWYNDRRKEFKF